jgi:hypothetical protein
MAELNKITGMSVGQFGVAVSTVIVDNDNIFIDISSYTTKQVKLRSPKALKTVTLSVSFTTDGSDGAVYFTPGDGDIDRPGTWLGMIILSKSGAETHTQEFSLDVGREF